MAITDQAQTSENEEMSDGTSAVGMQVQKRDGSKQTVDVNKIVRAVERCSSELPGVDPMRIATRTISGLHDEDFGKHVLQPAPRLLQQFLSHNSPRP